MRKVSDFDLSSRILDMSNIQDFAAFILPTEISNKEVLDLKNLRVGWVVTEQICTYGIDSPLLNNYSTEYGSEFIMYEDFEDYEPNIKCFEDFVPYYTKDV